MAFPSDPCRKVWITALTRDQAERTFNAAKTLVSVGPKGTVPG